MIHKTNIIVFIAALITLGIFVFVIPPDPDASRYENRLMAELPQLNTESILNGEYPTNLEKYFLDNIAFRTKFLAFSSFVENMHGVRLGGATVAKVDQNDLGIGMIPDPEQVYVDPFLPKFPGTEHSETSLDSGANSTTAPPAGDNTPIIQNNRVNPDKPFSIDLRYNPNAVVYGDFYVDPDSISMYVKILNEYRRSLPESVNIYCLLAPTKVEFMDEKYKANSSNQDTTIKNIYSRLDSGIVTVDAYSRISDHAKNEYLYFRTDHHWTALGA